MNKPAKKSLVPKLRFPEFREEGEWKIQPLDKLLTISNGRDYKHLYDGNFPVYGSGGYMLSVNDWLHDGESVCIGRKGTIDRPMFITGKFWTVDTLFYTHSFIDCLPKFIYAIFQQINWANHNEAGGVPSLSKTNIGKIKVAVPKSKEQQKIADCLSSLDDLISAQAQKLDALKTHKKGLMQQLFPAEGETIPKLRFPEFIEKDKWQLIPIGEKIELFSGYPFNGTDISDDPSGIKLLRGINITEGDIRHNQDIDRYYLGNIDQLAKYRVVENDLVIAMDGSKVGKNVALISRSDVGALLVQRVARLRAPNLTTIKYIFQWVNSNRFQSYVNRINTSSGIPHISAKQINDFQIYFSSEAEQQKIADCLSSLDDLISAHTQKLDALKNLKKGLMQQLFPAIDEVSA